MLGNYSKSISCGVAAVQATMALQDRTWAAAD